ncbi:MAG: hypothetical protein LBL04_05060 [Bacteroidales bacterium]|nr:hypothetical protein [Bacteroidales bacterium]
MPYSLQDILKSIDIPFELKGDACIEVDSFMPVEHARKGALSFIDAGAGHKEQTARDTQASVIICDLAEKQLPDDKCFILTRNPKLAFVKAVSALTSTQQEYGIHPAATVHPEAEIHPKTYIGPYTVIGQCRIGKGTVIYGHCCLYDRVDMGEQVTVNAGCVIGAAGFGFVRDENGIPHRFPHVGGVIIENHVEIGANTCIDRGSLGNTVIREGAKIDDMVHIGHNCTIGRYSYIISNAELGGSSVVGDYCWVAPSSTIINKARIGNRVTVGLGASVFRNIPDGETWLGYPAQPAGQFARLQLKLKKLFKQ